MLVNVAEFVGRAPPVIAYESFNAVTIDETWSAEAGEAAEKSRMPSNA
jgi:hypothetical protein